MIKTLNISIDYDNTYTKDPELWDNIIDIFQNFGHNVYCVTARRRELVLNPELQYTPGMIDESSDVLNSVGRKCPVIFTSRKGKRKYCEEIGIKIDIWVDDLPEFILYDVDSKFNIKE